MAVAAAVAMTAGLLAVTGAAAAPASQPTRPAQATGLGQLDGLLPRDHLTQESALQVDLSRESVRLPLYKGKAQGKTVWFVLLDASDRGLAADLGVNYAPKLANVGIGCPTCIETVKIESPTPQHNRFGPAVVDFQDAPNFAPTRTAVTGPQGFPLASFTPGAVGGTRYSPFIQIAGSPIVYNAPIVATGDGPFDVIDHADTHDRLMGIDTEGMTADLLFVRAFSHGEDIFYFTFDGSTPQQAVLERGTFTPVLGGSPFANASDHPSGARSAIFTFLNGQTGAESPPAQGADHVFSDGMLAETANLENEALLDALRAGGDSHNVLDSFTTLEDPKLAALYSPLWDLRVGVWSAEAVTEGLNVAQTDANEIRQLAADGLVTSPGGVALGSANIVINCPIFGFAEEAPAAAQAEPAEAVGIPPAGEPASS